MPFTLEGDVNGRMRKRVRDEWSAQLPRHAPEVGDEGGDGRAREETLVRDPSVWRGGRKNASRRARALPLFCVHIRNLRDVSGLFKTLFRALPRESVMMIQGSFEIAVTPEPPFDVVDGVSLSRVTVDKTFSGPLDATSKVYMTAARTKVEASGGYGAVERVTGVLAGKRGTFVLVHMGIMSRGTQTLSLVVVPDSGTGELAGISGKMAIRVEGGKHSYDFDYELPG